MNTAITRNIVSPLTYQEYKNLIQLYIEKGICSGEHSQTHIESTVMNAVRISRIDKQCAINENLKGVVAALSGNYTWILLTETWCGDSAQCTPVINKIASLNPNIDLKIIFRDENPEIMDEFLTNGTRSIPKLIILRNDEVIDTWGPRPKAIQKMVVDYKKNNPDSSHAEFSSKLHLWYAKDKTQAIQNEFSEMLKEH